MKFGQPRSHLIHIEFKKDGIAGSLERYVVALVNKEKE
ncbi:hypothetical protein BURMUCF2_A1492 [Burkholderia multivorans CF2]|nr:hypothetical protein BURMUCF2_A1492 [Burkholderia multivorans CF2]